MRYLYGPVSSARLGFSLGVDIVPLKTCVYDCIYCQQGRTSLKTMRRREYVPTEDVLEEVERFLSFYKGRLDCITFSGSGEPVLNSRIGTLIRQVKRMTTVPVVVLTGGALLMRESIREALSYADMVVPTLTSAKQETFEAIHRPCEGFSVEKIVQAYKEFKRVVKGRLEVEVMIISGYNDSESEIELLRDALQMISPDSVQMNTVRRPPSEKFARRVSLERLRYIGEAFGLPFTLPVRKAREEGKEKRTGRRLKEAVLEVIKRRPVTLSELEVALSVGSEQLLRALASLSDEDTIVCKKGEDGNEFYSLKERQSERGMSIE